MARIRFLLQNRIAEAEFQLIISHGSTPAPMIIESSNHDEDFSSLEDIMANDGYPAPTGEVDGRLDLGRSRVDDVDLPSHIEDSQAAICQAKLGCTLINGDAQLSSPITQRLLEPNPNGVSLDGLVEKPREASASSQRLGSPLLNVTGRCSIPTQACKGLALSVEALDCSSNTRQAQVGPDSITCSTVALPSAQTVPKRKVGKIIKKKHKRKSLVELGIPLRATRGRKGKVVVKDLGVAIPAKASQSLVSSKTIRACNNRLCDLNDDLKLRNPLLDLTERALLSAKALDIELNGREDIFLKDFIELELRNKARLNKISKHLP